MQEMRTAENYKTIQRAGWKKCRDFGLVYDLLNRNKLFLNWSWIYIILREANVEVWQSL